MPHLSTEDRAARRLVDGYLQLRAEAGVERAAAVAEFVRESAYTWANRLFALRCMEARSIIEEAILKKVAYAGRCHINDVSSATRRTGRSDWNSGVMPPFAAARVCVKTRAMVRR